jgi:hypothetical protein
VPMKYEIYYLYINILYKKYITYKNI